MSKRKALATYLMISPNVIGGTGSDFFVYNDRYLVLTDKEADKAMMEHADNIFNYFDASFLARFMPLTEHQIKCLQDAYLFNDFEKLIPKGKMLKEFKRCKKAYILAKDRDCLATEDGRERVSYCEKYFIYKIDQTPY